MSGISVGGVYSLLQSVESSDLVCLVHGYKVPVRIDCSG